MQQNNGRDSHFTMVDQITYYTMQHIVPQVFRFPNLGDGDDIVPPVVVIYWLIGAEVLTHWPRWDLDQSLDKYM